MHHFNKKFELHMKLPIKKRYRGFVWISGLKLSKTTSVLFTLPRIFVSKKMASHPWKKISASDVTVDKITEEISKLFTTVEKSLHFNSTKKSDYTKRLKSIQNSLKESPVVFGFSELGGGVGVEVFSASIFVMAKYL